MNYEDLLNKVTEEKINLIKYPFKGNAKGFYCDGCIALNSKIKTEKERKCILAEELGHYYTSHGSILDKSVNSIKQEHRARRWASERLITLSNLIDAFKLGIKGKSNLADYFYVTEEFLDSTISFYRKKYGTHHIVKNHIIFFEPNLSIVKMI